MAQSTHVNKNLVDNVRNATFGLRSKTTDGGRGVAFLGHRLARWVSDSNVYQNLSLTPLWIFPKSPFLPEMKSPLTNNVRHFCTRSSLAGHRRWRKSKPHHSVSCLAL